ncbi:synaptic vesicle glycoprotein 2C [Papilio machaon]|uniref:synaptic vesicle glycoprotein 2C n=1 Tax=Papilio machaon TaxID=76193 RepID=UPI001E6660FB|nr:synaptic vesicle glycoprotein 2C [Papilio machaon]
MAEEQACLVRARSDSESSSKLGSFGSITRTMTYTEDRLTGAEGAGELGNVSAPTASPPEQVPDGNESGELLDYNDSSVLEQFHEDALRQAGCGLSQARVLLAVTLAIAGASLELAAIPFVLPSAEIELCILPHEKNWLVLISLVGGSLGAVGWGALGERLGRRRTLLSCLAVNAVFAAIAAFMPTYGTFMMARFCSSIGSGGTASVGYTYCGEWCARARRRRALALLAAGAGAGALLAAALAHAVLPDTGADALRENKEHFSAWHRYLLLCTLPILASLVSLIWTQESPRYLLDVGREVDAMMVYQSIHSSNQFRVCGKVEVSAGAGAGAGDAEYRLGELTLPGKRRPPALHHVRHSVKMFWQAFFQLFSSPYRSTTISLGGILLFSMAIQYYLSSYVPATVVSAESEQFDAAKRWITNESFINEHYNETLENAQFVGVAFRDCNFRDMIISHVTFQNCTFTNVSFSNIMSSFTMFKDSVFINSSIIDTDMEVGRELSECVLSGSVVRGIRGGCARHADLRSHLAGLRAEQAHAARAALAGAALALLPHPTTVRPTVILCAACIVVSPSIYFTRDETMLYIIEAVYRLLVTLIFYNVGLDVVNSYPANLRCTAHGLILSVAYMGGAIVKGAGEACASLSTLLCALLALAATALSLYKR